MLPMASAVGQTTNDALGPPPEVPTAQSAGQAPMPARPVQATTPLAAPTEMASSPMPASAPRPTTSPEVAMPPTGPSQLSSTLSIVAAPSIGMAEENWMMKLLETVVASVADLQARITNVERNAVTTSSTWQMEGDQLQFEDLSRFPTRYESADVDADSRSLHLRHR